MALFQRSRILSQQRVDLPDYRLIEDFVCADFKAIFQNVWADENFVLSGFIPSGAGTNELSVELAGSTLLNGENDGTLYIGAPSLAPLTTTSLTPNTTNFVEISISESTGGADSRAFFDQTALGGAGAEFSQIIDTFAFQIAQLDISTSNFSGDPNKIPIAEVDVNGAGNIIAIRDARPLLWRLGRPNNPSFEFPFTSRVEPGFNFSGGDKDILTLKDAIDAIYTRIRENAGTNFWFETPGVSLTGAFRNSSLSILTAANTGSRFRWSGTELIITDDSSSPVQTDTIAFLRLLDSSFDLALTRQDGAQGIALADGESVYIQIPEPLDNASFSGVGLTSLNYQVAPRGSVPLNETTFWLAYREGTRLFLRGLGELEAGEERQINDETTSAVAEFLGFDPEIATSVPYTSFPDSAVFGNTYDVNSNLVEAISANTENLNAVGTVLDENAYSEVLDVISGTAANDNEIQGPVTSGTMLTLPNDSRDSDSPELYLVGDGILKLFLNGQLLNEGRDYNEVGNVGDTSNQVEILQQLEIGDVVTFRIDSLGGFNVGVGGGGSGDVSGAANVGGGEGEIFKQETAGILQLRTLTAGSGISIVTDTVNDRIIISLTGGVAAPAFFNCLNGQVNNLVNTGNSYNLGTNRLQAFRNGVLMVNSTSVGNAIDRFQESTDTTVLVESSPIASEVFCFINVEESPTGFMTITGQSSTVISVPSYVPGNDGLEVYRNGVLMNTQGQGNPVDRYTESSPTTISLDLQAETNDVFVVYVRSAPEFREEINNQTGTSITLSNSYNVGTQELLVFRNGILMFNSVTLGNAVDRYQESSSTTIELEQAAVATDRFTFLVRG